MTLVIVLGNDVTHGSSDQMIRLFRDHLMELGAESRVSTDPELHTSYGYWFTEDACIEISKAQCYELIDSATDRANESFRQACIAQQIGGI